MRRLLIGLLIIGAASATVVAQDQGQAKVAQGAPEFLALQKEYETARKKRFDDNNKEYEAARKEGKEKDWKPGEDPGPAFSKRFLALAEKDPEGPSGFYAIRAALISGGGPKGKTETWKPVIKLLREHYTTKPEIKRILSSVAAYGDETGDAFVRDVIARNPDRVVQVAAYYALIKARENTAMLSKDFLENENSRKSAESNRSMEEVAKIIAGGVSAAKEADGLRETLFEKYADIVVDLSVGRPMPELTSEGLDGKTVRLSELKGKVVVLDIWATWCGPCKAMIPHERDMVARLKDKPFQLVSISADKDKKTLKDFLVKESMPWTHWWNGTEGKLIEILGIEKFPTIFVLDAQGVIRHKEIRSEELEKAVNVLLKEMETKKTAAAK